MLEALGGRGLSSQVEPFQEDVAVIDDGLGQLNLGRGLLQGVFLCPAFEVGGYGGVAAF